MRYRLKEVAPSAPCLNPRVVLGGAFWYHPSDLRPAPAIPVHPKQVYMDQGFRIARTIME
jgi:formylglycine-generating enzyme required for sulfatase activity